MRRLAFPFALALLGLGVFLLVFAPLLVWYVEPHAKRSPIDLDSTSVVRGTGSYFDTKTLTTKDDQKLIVTRHVVGNVAASEKCGAVVWDVSTTLDNPKTLRFDDPRKSLQWDTKRWAADSRTSQPVHCEGESPAPLAGAALKFPFDVAQRSYRWWDGNLGAAVVLRYDGRAKVLGYEGLHFTSTVKPTEVGTQRVPGRLVGQPTHGQVNAEKWYSNAGVGLVVDQRTGRLLSTSTAPKMVLRAPGGKKDQVTLLHSDKLASTEKAQREAVNGAITANAKLRLVGETAPTVSAVAGTLLVIAGAVLVLRGGPGRGRDTADCASRK